MTNFANNQQQAHGRSQSACDLSALDANLPVARDQEGILTAINAFLEQLGRSCRYLKVPTVPETAFETLQGKRILLVDDVSRIAEHWTPLLISASNGNANAVIHTASTSAEELLERIISERPEIILLDYELAAGLKGSQLVEPIRTVLPDTLLIGFSSNSTYNRMLIESGAAGAVEKMSGDENSVLEAIAALFKEHSASSNPSLPKANQVEQGEGAAIEAAFNLQMTSDFVARHISTLVDCFYLREDAPEFQSVEYSQDKAHQLGIKKMQLIYEKLLQKIDTPFQRFLLASGDAIYYEPEVRRHMSIDDNYFLIQLKMLESLRFFFPQELAAATATDTIIAAASNGRHFALSLQDKEQPIRRIITANRLIELHDVEGYRYLDVSPEGSPFMRCVTARDGGRAFFDGERLMSHPSFRTCAPAVSFFEGGYIVNSTNCTIINGMLYPLVNEADQVAHTAGAWCGFVDFTTEEALESYRRNHELAKLLKVDRDGLLHLPERVVKPIGVFEPSSVEQLPNGFSHYHWSKFYLL